MFVAQLVINVQTGIFRQTDFQHAQSDLEVFGQSEKRNAAK